MSEQVDILIAGGGLVGLSLCAGLSESGFKTVVIDRQGPPVFEPGQSGRREGHGLSSGVSPGVSALGNAVRDFLSRTGVWSRIPASVITPFGQINVFDGGGTGAVTFKAEEAGVEQLGFIVENNHIIKALFDRISEMGESELHNGVEIERIEKSDDGYLVEAGGHQWQTNLLVGADGSESQVRKIGNFHTLKWAYAQSAVVSTIEISQPHANTARQWFTESGILAFLPLPNEHYCSIVLSSEDTDALMSMDEGEFCEHLGRLSEGMLGSIRGVDKRFSFALRQQHSLRYVAPHIALLGDAAHTIHPLAGQGANIGFADARTLAQVIKQARLEGRLPGDIDLLRRYQRMRQPDNMLTATVMEAFVRGFGTTHPGMRWLRNSGMKLVNQSGFLKSLVVKMATERTGSE